MVYRTGTMISRRVFLWSLSLGSLAAAVSFMPSIASARCAMIEPAVEIRDARFVFEGTVVAVGERSFTFEVNAVWKGDPPARVTVQYWAPRRRPSPADVGRQWIVLAVQSDDGALSASRCGSSGELPMRANVAAALQQLRLTRHAR